MLRDNADSDGHLRHAGVMGLAGAADVNTLVSAAADPSPAARMGVLLALRRWRSPEVARFLDDAEPRLVLEAARAIHDEDIAPALPRLAALLNRTGLPDLLLYRVLNAHFRLSTRRRTPTPSLLSPAGLAAPTAFASKRSRCSPSGTSPDGAIASRA